MAPANEAIGWRAQDYAACGRKAEAQKVMNELLELSKVHYVFTALVRRGAGGPGKQDEAFNWLDQAIDRRFGPMIYLK